MLSVSVQAEGDVKGGPRDQVNEREGTKQSPASAPHTYCPGTSVAADPGLTIHRKTNKLLSEARRDPSCPVTFNPYSQKSLPDSHNHSNSLNEELLSTVHQAYVFRFYSNTVINVILNTYIYKISNGKDLDKN